MLSRYGLGLPVGFEIGCRQMQGGPALKSAQTWLMSRSLPCSTLRFSPMTPCRRRWWVRARHNVSGAVVAVSFQKFSRQRRKRRLSFEVLEEKSRRTKKHRPQTLRTRSRSEPDILWWNLSTTEWDLVFPRRVPWRHACVQTRLDRKSKRGGCDHKTRGLP